MAIELHAAASRGACRARGQGGEKEIQDLVAEAQHREHPLFRRSGEIGITRGAPAVCHDVEVYRGSERGQRVIARLAQTPSQTRNSAPKTRSATVVSGRLCPPPS